MCPRLSAESKLATVVGMVLIAACGRPPAPRAPDLVLVSIDTLRADRLGSYGATTGATPELDRLRRRAVQFRTVVAQAPATLSSHASLFTSRLPQHHGAAFAAGRALPESELTLAEVLRDHGYRTLALTAGGQMLRRFGVGQGFQRFRAQWERSESGAFAKKVERALKVLGEDDPRPLFLFLHTYEVHLPYTPEPDVVQRLDPDYDGSLGESIEVHEARRINDGGVAPAARDARRIRAAHDAELYSVDSAFAQLAAAVAARDARRPTLLTLTSDHGEELGEHGDFAWHGHTLYDELLLVPWLLWLPGGESAGLEVELPVRGIDLAPTLLELVGIARPAEFEGRSLVPLLRGGKLDELPAVFERTPSRSESFGGIRWRGWKLHEGMLFDLRSDPGERTDRAAAAARLRAELDALLAAAVSGASRSAAAPLDLDAEAAEQLRALGYLN
jgi:arylsulfatase A-like enzyme